MNKYILNLALIFLISSQAGCSFFVNLYSDSEQKDSDQILKEQSCLTSANRPKPLLISSNKYIDKLADRIPQTSSMAEQLAYLVLMQMNYAPQLITLNSKITIFELLSDKQSYYTITNSNYLSPTLLQTLDLFLKQKNSRQSLHQIAANIDRVMPENLPIDANLEYFIKKNFSQLRRNEFIEEKISKGGIPLGAGETIPKINFVKLIQTQLKIAPNRLKQINMLNSAQVNCSFDVTSDETKLKQDMIHQSTFIALSDNSTTLIATIDTNPTIEDLKQTDLYFYSGPLDQSDATPFCQMKLANKQTLTVFAFGDRSPEQFLKQYLDANLNSPALSSEQIIESLKQPRKLYLQSPARYLLEVNYNASQITDSPIYYTSNLGELFIATQTEGSKYLSFYKDPRKNIYNNCEQLIYPRGNQ